MATPLRPAAPAHPAPLVRAARVPDPAQLRSLGGSRRRGPLPRVVRRAPPPRAAPRRGGRAGRARRARRRAADAGATSGARWVVRLDDGSTIEADHVVVATGYNHTPVAPDWPGLDGFTGEVVLARDYRNGRPFAGRDVLVVGSGNTGMEIATDLADHGATRVWLAVRTPPHILPRSRMGWPAQGTGILVRRLPPRLVDRVAAVLAVVQEPDLTGYGLPKPGTDLYSRVLVGPDPGAGRRHRRRHPQPGGSSRWRPCEAVEGSARRARRRLARGAVRRRRRHRLPGRPRAARRPPRGARRPRPAPGARRRTSPTAPPGLWFTGYTNPISGMLRELRIDAERIAAAVSREGARSPA